MHDYRQDAAKRQTAGIVFTHRPKIRFFAPQGRVVAPIQVKLCSIDRHLGPLGWAKFHVNRCRRVGMGMGFAPTWLRRVSPPTTASQNHFNRHCTNTTALSHASKYHTLHRINHLHKTTTICPYKENVCQEITNKPAQNKQSRLEIQHLNTE